MRPLHRRTFLEAIGVLALGPGSFMRSVAQANESGATPAVAQPGSVLNDVHSELNPTRVTRVVEVTSVDEILRAIHGARSRTRAARGH